jgi:signal transduction histidine kinase
MSVRGSLSVRLSVSLLVALVLTSATCFALMFTLFSKVEGVARPNLNWYAEDPARARIVESLVRVDATTVSIEPRPELRELSARMPHLKYAVFDPASGAPLAGSSPELAASLRRFVVPLKESDGVSPMSVKLRFLLTEEGRPDLFGGLMRVETPLGPYLMAIYGFEFEWSYVRRIVVDTMITTLGLNGLVFACGALVVWFAVRRGLAPLRAAADHARAIDMDSLEQRLPETNMPSEIAPFVRAVNEALERLGEGVARQRRFVANAAHQLCTPIAILRARIDDPRDDDLRRDMRRDLRRLQAIVEQLLVSARLNERGGDTRERFDLAAAVRLKVADYAPLMRENRRRVEFEGPSSPIMLCGDRRALESVVANLVDNALHAEPENGAIVVRLTNDAELFVVDHGEGVVESDRELIFEPFWRKNEARPGTGLGLAIAKEIVELHGGRISVLPTPGGGATFRVAFVQVEAAQNFSRRPEARNLAPFHDGARVQT